MKLDLHKPEYTQDFWRLIMEISVVHVIAMYFLGFVFGVFNFMQLLGNIFFVGIGLLCQVFLFGPRFFRSAAYQHAVEGRDRVALFFGQELAVRSKDINPLGRFFGLKIGVVVLVLVLLFRFFFQAPFFREGLTLCGSLVSMALACMATTSLAWMPASVMMAVLLLSGVAPQTTTISGVIYVSGMLLLNVIFALRLGRACRHHGASQKNKQDDWSLNEPTVRAAVFYGVFAAALFYGYCRQFPIQVDRLVPKSTQANNLPQLRNGKIKAGQGLGSSGGSSASGALGGRGTQENYVNDGSLAQDGDPSSSGHAKSPGTSDQEGQATQPELNSGGDGKDPTGDSESRDSKNMTLEADVAEDGKLPTSGVAAGGGESGDESGGGRLGQRSEVGAAAKVLSKAALKFEFKIPKFPKKAWRVVVALLLIGMIGFLIWRRFSRKKEKPVDSLSKSHQALRQALQNLNHDLAVDIANWSATPVDVKHKVVEIYNKLLQVNDGMGLKRDPAMTPDEYSLFFWANAPKRGPAMQLVTNVYSRVFFGNETPDQVTLKAFVDAAQKSLAH
jgi:hypothetical protein